MDRGKNEDSGGELLASPNPVLNGGQTSQSAKVSSLAQAIQAVPGPERSETPPIKSTNAPRTLAESIQTLLWSESVSRASRAAEDVELERQGSRECGGEVVLVEVEWRRLSEESEVLSGAGVGRAWI